MTTIVVLYAAMVRTSPAASVGSGWGHANACEHGGQDIRQQSETVKWGQKAQQHVAARGLQGVAGRCNQVPVGKRDRLGRAFGARGEQHNRRGIDLGPRQPCNIRPGGR